MTRFLDLPLDALHLSPLNPRRVVTDAEIAEFADSIHAQGLLNPLTVLHSPGETGPDAPPEWQVVAGGRRLRAIQVLAAAGRWPADRPVPCHVTDDADQARLWAGSENFSRRDLHPADEAEAYAAMARAGFGTRAIALHFTVTEQHVRQRLKLAALWPEALAALRDNCITLDQAQVLTLCPDPERRAPMLDMALRGDSAWGLRSTARAETLRLDDPKVLAVGLDAYRAAGGAIIEDLFGADPPRLASPDIVESLLVDVIDRKLAEARAEGWLWADYTPDLYNAGKGLTRIYGDDIGEGGVPEFTPAQRAVAGTFIGFRHNGTLGPNPHSAFIRPQDIAAARAAGVLDDDTPTPAASSAAPEDDGTALSATLLADLRAVQLHAVQAALADNPDLLFDLLAFQLHPASGANPKIFDVRIGQPRNAPEVADGFTPSDALASAEERGTGLPDLTAAFGHFRMATTSEVRRSIVTTALARSLLWGCTMNLGGTANPFWSDILDRTGADPRLHWTPTEAGLFTRMRAAALDAAHAELLDLPPEHRACADFRAMKKGEKAKLLHAIATGTPAQRAGVKGWTPAAEQRLSAWFPEVA
jgi:ParB family transcriptional regulator, chromosome partitioning protein